MFLVEHWTERRRGAGYSGPQKENSAFRRRVQMIVSYMDELEAPLVRRIALRADRSMWRGLSYLLNRLGNGWLYLALTCFTLGKLGERAIRPDLTAVSSVAIAFSVYFPLKLTLARVRPCDRDPSLLRSARALDAYSCPSGHCMTISAVGCVFFWEFPKTLPVALAGLLAMGWTRLALGHHYLSDLVLGTAIGVMVSAALCTVAFR